jgi:hypothetical protein
VHRQHRQGIRRDERRQKTKYVAGIFFPVFLSFVAISAIREIATVGFLVNGVRLKNVSIGFGQSSMFILCRHSHFYYRAFFRLFRRIHIFVPYPRFGVTPR